MRKPLMPRMTRRDPQLADGQGFGAVSPYGKRACSATGQHPIPLPPKSIEPPTVQPGKQCTGSRKM